MIFRITKEFQFQMAHALEGYDGKCRNIHGHNYRLFVTVEGHPVQDNASTKKGMVMDFGDLKAIVEQCVIDLVDHSLMVAKSSNFVCNMDTKIVRVDFQPTSENMLLWFARLLDGRFPDGVRLQSLRLYETDSSCVELIL